MKGTRTNSEAFLTIYNELDNYMRSKSEKNYWAGHTALLREMAESNNIFKRHYDMLCEMASLRNAIIHNPYKRSIDPIAEPHAEIVKMYAGIARTVMNPPLAIEVLAIRRKDIFTTTKDANAHAVMQAMNKHSYTHVPVLDGELLLGVFSENTIFSYLVKNQIFALDEEITIGEFAEFIPLDSHENEYFEFVSRDASVIDVEELFHLDVKKEKRLSAVFVTHKGDPGEKILGLITPWDLVKDASSRKEKHNSTYTLKGFRVLLFTIHPWLMLFLSLLYDTLIGEQGQTRRSYNAKKAALRV